MIKNKNEKGKELFELLGGLDEDIVEDAWTKKGGKIMLNKRGYIGKTIIAAAAVFAVAAGIFGAYKLNGIRSAGSEPGVILSPSDSPKNFDYIIRLQEITSAKCYKVDFLEPTEDQVIALFKGVPKRSEHTKALGDVDFRVGDETGYIYGAPGCAHYEVLYWTEQGFNYDTAAYSDYEEIAVNRDWDFLSRADAEKKISEILSPFMPAGTSVTTYSIRADDYSEYAKQHANQLKNPENLDELKDWGTPEDYYYFVAEQAVDDIPILQWSVKDINTGTSTHGADASGVLSADGLGFLHVRSPYKIVGEVETPDKFITFSEAKQMFNEIFDSFIKAEAITVNDMRLVYVVVNDEDNGMILNPAWEFNYKYTDEQERSFCINAYTGEEINIQN